MLPHALPTRVDLTVGEARLFELPGLGTAGYIWRESVDGPSGVIDVAWHRGFPEGAPVPAVGASAPETLELRAAGPGEVTLRLVQARPWERDVAPEHEHTMLVHVEPASEL